MKSQKTITVTIGEAVLLILASAFIALNIYLLVEYGFLRDTGNDAEPMIWFVQLATCVFGLYTLIVIISENAHKTLFTYTFKDKHAMTPEEKRNFEEWLKERDSEYRR